MFITINNICDECYQLVGVGMFITINNLQVTQFCIK